jgi:hypothetical protein
VRTGGELTPADDELEKCQKQAYSTGASYLKTVWKHLIKCEDKVLNGKLDGGTDCRAEEADKIIRAFDKMSDKLGKKCSDENIDALFSPLTDVPAAAAQFRDALDAAIDSAVSSLY